MSDGRSPLRSSRLASRTTPALVSAPAAKLATEERSTINAQHVKFKEGRVPATRLHATVRSRTDMDVAWHATCYADTQTPAAKAVLILLGSQAHHCCAHLCILRQHLVECRQQGVNDDVYVRQLLRARDDATVRLVRIEDEPCAADNVCRG